MAVNDEDNSAGGVLGSAGQGAATGSVAGPWGAVAGAAVGLGVGAYNANKAAEARKKRLQLIQDAKTYSGNANPYESEAMAENNYKGLSQEALRPGQEVDLGVNSATTTAQRTGTSASSILSAISGIQANANQSKRGIASDVQDLKDRRLNTVIGTKEGVKEDQQAVFDDQKQKQQALIGAQADQEAYLTEQAAKGGDLAAGSLIAGASTIGGGDGTSGARRRARRAQPDNMGALSSKEAAPTSSMKYTPSPYLR